LIKKVYYTDKQIDALIHNILRQIIKDQWVPDYIVGLTRGGLVPAVKISQYLDIPLETVKVSLRDGSDDGCESNCWMAEDAYDGKKILIVDDINDTGATLEWIKKDWQSSAFPGDEKWDGIWNESVRFAALIDNDQSLTQINYIGKSINKAEDPHWVIFPWENWWEND
jgi:hypoxanthine phosphoribosyltransferase